MQRRMIWAVLAVLALTSFPLKAADQKTKPSALANCKAEVDRLKAENADLQKKLNDLLTKPLEAMKKPAEAESAALAAIRALASVSDTAGYADFKKYLLDAKVKVESLSPGPSKNSMSELLGAFLEVESMWAMMVRGAKWLTKSDLSDVEKTFPGVLSRIEPVYENGSIVASYYVPSLLSDMVLAAKQRVEAFSIPSRDR